MVLHANDDTGLGDIVVGNGGEADAAIGVIQPVESHVEEGSELFTRLHAESLLVLVKERTGTINEKE